MSPRISTYRNERFMDTSASRAGGRKASPLLPSALAPLVVEAGGASGANEERA